MTKTKLTLLAIAVALSAPFTAQAMDLFGPQIKVEMRYPAPIPPATCLPSKPTYIVAYETLMVPKVSGLLVGAFVFQSVVSEFEKHPEAKVAWDRASEVKKLAYSNALAKAARTAAQDVEQRMGAGYHASLPPVFCIQSGPESRLPTAGPVKEVLDFQLDTLSRVFDLAAKGLPRLVELPRTVHKGELLDEVIGYSEMLPDFPFVFGGSLGFNTLVLLGVESEGPASEKWMKDAIALYGEQTSAARTPVVHNPVSWVQREVPAQLLNISPTSKAETAEYLKKTLAPVWAVLEYTPQ